MNLCTPFTFVDENSGVCPALIKLCFIFYFLTVLQGLVSLLIEPDLDNPLDQEAADLYKKNIEG